MAGEDTSCYSYGDDKGIFEYNITLYSLEELQGAIISQLDFNDIRDTFEAYDVPADDYTSGTVSTHFGREPESEGDVHNALYDCLSILEGLRGIRNREAETLYEQQTTINLLQMSRNTLDIFCGGGGLSHGFKEAGFTIKAGIDGEEDYLQTYNANHENNGICLNLLEVTPEEFFDKQDDLNPEDIQVVIGGPPCKGFSMAGKRNPDDTRNTLVDIFINYVAYIQPEIVVMENVTGMSSLEKPNGDNYLDSAVERLQNEGYSVSVNQLNAKDYGVPQSRERIFIIASKDPLDLDLSPTVTKPKTVQEAFDNIDPNAPNQEETNHSSDMTARLEKLDIGESLYDNYSSSWKRIDPEKPSPTIKQNNGAPFVHPTKPRVGTVRECAKLQSFPDDFEFKGAKTHQLHVIGNAVPPGLAEAVANALIDELEDEE